MEIIYKHVDFAKYCGGCKYINTMDTDEPCDECLRTPVNVYSQKPINFKALEVKK